MLSLVDRPEGTELIGDRRVSGRPRFRGLGELTLRARHVVAAARTAHGRRTPSGAPGLGPVRAPSPDAMRALLTEETSALPYLAGALRRLLAELPDASGLSLTERLILEALMVGPVTPGELFEATQDREEAPFAGDSWLWTQVAGLRSLVTIDDGSERVAITDAGRRVVAGEATGSHCSVSTAGSAAPTCFPPPLPARSHAAVRAARRGDTCSVDRPPGPS